ncbi:hypothetical protein [Nocardia wallacei]|uniref:hypothetical protein n=1 Tax=Nocardia wallacei TaxID=480035 RepID=UPI0024563BE2|nr:hypothetical protein [Nocardia wallacei]
MTDKTLEDIARIYEQMTAEVAPLLRDGWMRTPDRERPGFGVFATRAAGDFSAQISSNVHIWPEWTWATKMLRHPVGAASADTAADAIRQAEEAWRQNAA